MLMASLIIDSRPPYLARQGEALSLLSLPLGTTTVLGYLMDRIWAAGGRRTWVFPALRDDERYPAAIRRISSGAVEVIRPEDFSRVLETLEPSDTFAVLDPRHWPANGFDLAPLLEERPDPRWAVHAVTLGGRLEHALEDVRCDAAGYVQRVRRYYDQVTWPHTGSISASALTASVLDGVAFSSPTHLRALLTQRGVLSRDVCVASSYTDLVRERGYLALCETFVVQQTKEAAPPGFVHRGEEALIGAECRIDPSAQLMGPIIIHAEAQVEADALIIGPAVIGAAGRVGRGSVVAQCALADGAHVRDGQTVRQRLVIASSAGLAGVEPGGSDDSSAETAQAPASLLDPLREPEVASFRDAARERHGYLALKRVTDAAWATIILLLLLPVLVVVTILIRWDSPGPVFYLDRREGRGGKVFKCIKFRTMQQNAHQQQRELYAQSAVDGPQFKLRQDPRVTRIGRWLRSTNLDELPQLFNVVAGEMSLVGPRPSPFRENQICVPWRQARLSVRPGITGLWQICRHDRDEGDFHQWIHYDIAYVRHMSFWLDFKILLATLLTAGGRWNVPESWLLTPSRPSLGAALPAAVH